MPLPAAHSQEYEAARREVARADGSLREQVLVTGPDRVSFVQGMVSNDVEALAMGGSCEATLLTAKGSMVALVRVLKLAERVVLDTGPGHGAAVAEFLNKYLISEDAEVAPTQDYTVLSLVGPQAKAWAEKVSAQVGVLPSSIGDGVDVLLPRGAPAPEVESRPSLSPDTCEVLRVEAGLPRFGADLTETTIPMEANLQRALSYTKGCYIGQEVVARGTHRGQMNKRLMGLLLGEAEAAPGAELRVGDRKVGWLTSVVRSIKKGQVIGLGYVHRDFVAEGTALEVSTGGKATVTALPFA